MNKNTILVINPISKNIMKAIYNAIIVNLINIIIIGDRKIIYALCIELNINIQLLQIVDCNNIQNLKKKLEEYKLIKNIKGIIIDDIPNGTILSSLTSKSICKIIDFGVFDKSVYLIKNTFNIIQIEKIKETIKIINSLNIYEINIGIITSNRKKSMEIKQTLEKRINVNKIKIIKENKIKKSKYNIILFDDMINEEKFLTEINNKILQRVIEIKKASNIYVFDAKQKELKIIFLQLLFLSKIDKLIEEINTKII